MFGPHALIQRRGTWGWTPLTKLSGSAHGPSLVPCLYDPVLRLFFVHKETLGTRLRMVLVLLCNIHLERASCFTLIVFLMSRDCSCSVSFPRCAVGWSVAFECGIS